ncbi:hypothetical protein [Caballeronia fortuita]|uniref:hypothetical protein n=1 Tax=Caballeronia fortuita TaxID=1777138 RepID=UPI001428B219|nr:hypothetical protein [Caballeronia fortuita]
MKLADGHIINNESRTLSCGSYACTRQGSFRAKVSRLCGLPSQPAKQCRIDQSERCRNGAYKHLQPVSKFRRNYEPAWRPNQVDALKTKCWQTVGRGTRSWRFYSVRTSTKRTSTSISARTCSPADPTATRLCKARLDRICALDQRSKKGIGPHELQACGGYLPDGSHVERPPRRCIRTLLR